MRGGFAALGLAILSACAAPDRVPVYRDITAPISSATRFDSGLFAGRWFTIEAAGTRFPAELSFTYEGAGRFSYVGAEPFNDRLIYNNQAVFNLVDAGRLVSESNRGDVVWVLWVDEDHRTAVLGNPAGTFAQIINRTPQLRADRLAAAREVLAFNGYDLAKLRRIAR